MKLIDILVEELPKMGGWPEGASRLAQDPDGDIQMLSNRHAYLVSVGWTGDGRSDCYGQYAARKLEPLASDYDTSIITREQYESALAAKSEGWIEWGGGECPVDAAEMVDVIFGHGGRMSANIAGCCRWNHDGTDSDIIAYRPHNPQEAEQAETDDETNLNECIGQDAAPVWNGDGLPPVGVECEYTKESLPGNEWTQCTVDYVGASFVVYRDCYGVELTGIIGDIKFRPIRSEADEKRDDRASAIDGFISGFRGQKTGSNKELAYAITDYLALLDKL